MRSVLYYYHDCKIKLHDHVLPYLEKDCAFWRICKIKCLIMFSVIDPGTCGTSLIDEWHTFLNISPYLSFWLITWQVIIKLRIYPIVEIIHVLRWSNNCDNFAPHILACLVTVMFKPAKSWWRSFGTSLAVCFRCISCKKGWSIKLQLEIRTYLSNEMCQKWYILMKILKSWLNLYHRCYQMHWSWNWIWTDYILMYRIGIESILFHLIKDRTEMESK